MMSNPRKRWQKVPIGIKMESEEKNDIWEINNLPNRLTIFRVLLVPLLLICYIPIIFEIPISDDLVVLINYTATTLFIIASITDFFDGYFARRKNLVTVFGSFLDPIADKFLVVTSLILLLALTRVHPFIVVILIMRELYITSLRLLAINHNISVPVGSLGKWKTALQMVAIPFLLANTFIQGISTLLTGTVLIYGAAILSLYSAFEYSMGLLKKLKNSKKIDND